MATVKTPEERGPLGAWAYDSRDRLDISPEQVVDMLGKYDTSTIRKAEGNSAEMSRPLWRALTKLYARVASERSITLDAMPQFGESEPTPDPTLAAAVAALTDELAAMRLEREAWTRGVVGVLRAYAAGQVPEALLDALAPPPHVDAR